MIRPPRPRRVPTVRGQTAPSRVACLMLAAALAPGCEPPQARHPAVGRAVGTLPLIPIAGVAEGTPTFTGRVTLLNFWGAWCPPCRRELPGLARLAARLADEPRFQLVAVSCGAGAEDTAEVVHDTREFLRQRDLSIPAWTFGDPLGRLMATQMLGLDAFPTTYLIGPDGRVRQVWRGYRPSDEPEIAAAVLAALKEAAAPPAAAMRSSRAPAAAAGSAAAVTAVATANRRIPRAARASIRSGVIPPMAKAGSPISATTPRRNAAEANAANDFVADGKQGPTPI
jgi:thiol-disulfide isomerase/thioredoxin